MSVLARTYGREITQVLDEPLFSSDSHVIEPDGLWKRELPSALRDRAPDMGGKRGGDHPGAMEKTERVKEMTADGTIGEVLYPTHGLRVLSLEDTELEEACCSVYNDWLIDYCQAAPDRLVGLAMLSVYNVEHAVHEMERCRQAGLRGVTIWQVPHPDLPFTSDHYDRFWAAAQDTDMPVSLHILSGFGYSRARNTRQGAEQQRRSLNEQQRNSVNLKLAQSIESLHDLIFGGVLDRFPRLKVVLAESEIGWLPFVLEQWDYYYKRHGASRTDGTLTRDPSAYFHDQVYATFFNDAVGGHLLSWWGEDNCMWSSDYPHGNSTWPNSREVVARDLGELPAAKRAKLVRENVARCYNMPVPAPVALRVHP